MPINWSKKPVLKYIYFKQTSQATNVTYIAVFVARFGKFHQSDRFKHNIIYTEHTC